MSADNEQMSAFPVSYKVNSEVFVQDGMTLRDYFAGQALAGMDGDNPPDAMAAWAYEAADAMMKERDKKQ